MAKSSKSAGAKFTSKRTTQPQAKIVRATTQRFLACPARREGETAERKRARLACLERAKETGLSLAKTLDTRSTLFTPQGWRYSSGHVIEAARGSLNSEQRREYGCVEEGSPVRERVARGCVRDAKGAFTGSLSDGTSDPSCKLDRDFTGSRRVGTRLVRDQLCTGGFKPPCEGPRYTDSKHCPVQFVVVGGQTGIRLCHGQNMPGELVSAPDSQAIENLSRSACEWWTEHGRPRTEASIKARAAGNEKQFAKIAATVWDGFLPATPKGFGSARKRPR